MELKEKIINATKGYKKIGLAAVICTALIGGGIVSAHNQNYDHGACRNGDHNFAHNSATYIQDTAKEKGITLIDEEKAKSIAIKTVGLKDKDVQFSNIYLLHDKHNASNEFKPFYAVRCFANGIGYNVRIDAVSGEVMKDLPQMPNHERQHLNQNPAQN